MKILFLTNFYPPYTIGGMENRCQQVADHLKSQGHTILVLTSIYGQNQSSQVDNHIHRVLHLEANMVHYRPLHFFTSRFFQERKNLEKVKHLVNIFMPDLIFVWGMWNLSRKILVYLEHVFPEKVVYSLACYWPAQPNLHMAYWNLPAQHSFIKPLKHLVGKIAFAIMDKENAKSNLQFSQVICVSNSLKNALLKENVPLKNVQVIYPGINLEQFVFSKKTIDYNSNANHLSLLYAGALVHHKGVHSAIEALAQVIKARPGINIKLTILGSGHPDYEKYLKRLVDQKKLHKFIQFVPQIPRQKMSEILKKHDVLIFPSIWEEPFSRAILEAMASGLAVVGTNIGGTKEILIDGVNGLTFEPEDSNSLADCIQKLYDNPMLRITLGTNAHDTVIRQYDIKQMNVEIENYLANLVHST